MLFKVLFHSSLQLDLDFKLSIFPKAACFSENLISAKLPVLGMQFKTIDFPSNTLLSIFLPVSSPPLSLIMFFFFSPCLPVWFHSEQCRCQLISRCRCHRAPSNSWRSAMPHEYQTASTVRQVLSSQTQHSQSGAGAHKQPDSFIRVCLTRSKVWQHPSPLMKSSPLPQQ